MYFYSALNTRCELGYWILDSFQRKGFATEAIDEIITYARDDLGMHRIEAWTDEQNHPSRRLLSKTGFQLDGILKHDERSADGARLINTAVYSITSSGE